MSKTFHSAEIVKTAEYIRTMLSDIQLAAPLLEERSRAQRKYYDRMVGETKEMGQQGPGSQTAYGMRRERRDQAADDLAETERQLHTLHKGLDNILKELQRLETPQIRDMIKARKTS